MSSSVGSTSLRAKKGGTLIKFPLPEEISFDTAYGWEKFASGSIGIALENFLNGNLDEEAGKSLAKRWGANFANKLVDQGAVAGVDGFGIAVNPKEEILFRGVSQREFSLSFNIASKSAAKMAEYLGMMNTFYKLAAPRIVDANTFLEFPTLWELSIQDSGRDIIKQREVAVKRIMTLLTPDGPFNTYTNGAPVHIRVNCDFIETIIPNEESDSNIFGV